MFCEYLSQLTHTCVNCVDVWNAKLGMWCTVHVDVSVGIDRRCTLFHWYEVDDGAQRRNDRCMVVQLNSPAKAKRLKMHSLLDEVPCDKMHPRNTVCGELNLCCSTLCGAAEPQPEAVKKGSALQVG